MRFPDEDVAPLDQCLVLMRELVEVLVWIVDSEEEQAELAILCLHVADESQLLALEEIVHLDFPLHSLEIVDQTVVSLLFGCELDYSVASLVDLLDQIDVVLCYFDLVGGVRLVVVIVANFAGLVWPVAPQVVRPRAFDCLRCLVVNVADFLAELPVRRLLLLHLELLLGGGLFQANFLLECRALRRVFILAVRIRADAPAYLELGVLHFVDDHLSRL